MQVLYGLIIAVGGAPRLQLHHLCGINSNQARCHLVHRRARRQRCLQRLSPWLRLPLQLQLHPVCCCQGGAGSQRCAVLPTSAGACRRGPGCGWKLDAALGSDTRPRATRPGLHVPGPALPVLGRQQRGLPLPHHPGVPVLGERASPPSSTRARPPLGLQLSQGLCPAPAPQAVAS